MTPEDKEEGEKEGAPSALGKIAQAGYSSLDVSVSFTNLWIQFASRRLIVNPILHMRARRSTCVDHSERYKSTSGRRCHSVCRFHISPIFAGLTPHQL